MRLARAQSAARATEDSDEEEDEGREEREEVARVRYKHALRKLAEAFPELEIPAGLSAGLHASEQGTRPCALPLWCGAACAMAVGGVDKSPGLLPGRGGRGGPGLSGRPTRLGGHLLAQGVDWCVAAGGGSLA